MIGYGAMLIEGLVGVVALIAAASLPNAMYYDINIDLAKRPQFARRSTGHRRSSRRRPRRPTRRASWSTIEKQVGGESLRGRTGGAVTLAVGMARIFSTRASPAAMNVARSNTGTTSRSCSRPCSS